MRFFRSTPRVLPAHVDEAGDLANLFERSWGECDRLLGPNLIAVVTPPVAEVNAWFRGGFEVFRARHDGQLMGAVRCCFPSSTCNLDRLAVHPGARRRGVGQLLLEHALGRARRAGVIRVWTQISPRAESSWALFRSFGFRETGRTAVGWGDEVALLELPL
jgi:ribosomal protein S18 acetylase RimI-like enzyme